MPTPREFAWMRFCCDNDLNINEPNHALIKKAFMAGYAEDRRYLNEVLKRANEKEV